MSKYDKMKERHPFRQDIILIIVLLLLILTAIIFPRFKEPREPVVETEIIYIEPEKKMPHIDGNLAPEPDMVGSLLQDMNEKSIPPKIIEDAIDFEWPVLDTFDIQFNKAVEEISPKGVPPFPPKPSRKRLSPEEIWEIYYKEIVKRDPNGEPELGFNLSGYSEPYLEWGCQDYDTPPSPRGGRFALEFNNLEYPLELLKKGIEDTVNVVLFVEADGSLSLVRLLMPGKNKEFELASVIAVTRSDWEPAKKNGLAVPAALVYPVEFNLYKKSLIVNSLHHELIRRNPTRALVHFPFPRLIGG